MIKAILLATVVPFMAQHRNIVPSNEVTTNFYGSVTGVVTRAYIAERGGGGLEPRDVGLIATNVVTNVVTKSYITDLTGCMCGRVLHANYVTNRYVFDEPIADVLDSITNENESVCIINKTQYTRKMYWSVVHLGENDDLYYGYYYGNKSDGTQFIEALISVRPSTDLCNLVPNIINSITAKDVGGISTNVVTNIVTKSFVEELGISGSGGITNRIESGTNTITALGEWIVVTNSISKASQTNFLCTVAAAKSMTNSVMSAANSKFLRSSYPGIGSDGKLTWDENVLTLSDAIFIAHSIRTQGTIFVPSWYSIKLFVGGNMGQDLQQYLASTSWHGYNKNLSDYGIVDAYTKSEADNKFEPRGVTNLYGVGSSNLIDGDRNVYVKLPFSAWTNDTAGAGGIIPAGLRFEPQADSWGADFIWKAEKGSDTYLLVEDRESGGMSDFSLLKNGESPFPQAWVSSSTDSVVLDFRTFKLYKFGSGEMLVNTDSLALGSFASNINAKVDTRTTRSYLANTIGWGNANQVGLLGIYSSSNHETAWPFSKNYWDLYVYPEVQEWVGNNYVPKTRKINGQTLTTDITIQSMDYQAVTNTVNAVKAQFYDEPLQVNWTLKMVNGEMKLYATTNVNMSVL